MNRIYKVIWNEALNCFTAVGEYAKARGKSSKSSVSANATINTTENLSSTSAFKLTAIGLGLMAAGFCIQANAASDFEGDIGGKLDASIQLNIVGGESNPINLTDNNIGVVGSGGGDDTTPNDPKTLTIKLAKDIDLTHEGSLTIGDTLVDNSGITITNIDQTKTVSLTSTGLNNGGNQITNVFSGGEVETNAANIGDVNRVVSANRIKYFSVKSTGGTNEDNLGAQGVDAIAIGKGASAVGQTTVAIGLNSGSGSTAGTEQGVSVGNASGQNVLSSGNVGIGRGAGSNVSATPRATVGGNPAYRPYSIEGQNTAIGADAGNGVYGDSNSALGERAGRNVDGHANTAIGAFSGNAVIGSANVAMGPTAGYTVTGDRNTAVGNFSGSHVVGKANSAFGNGAGSNVTGEYNLALGAGAGAGITNDLTVAIGNNAGNFQNGQIGKNSISVGTNSSAQGHSSMALGRGSVSAGINAIGIGVQSIASATGTIAVGDRAEASGENAIAIGKNSLATGSQAIGVGSRAGNGGAAYGDNADAGGTIMSATPTVIKGTAIGNGSIVNVDNGVALGFKSVANRTATGLGTVFVPTSASRLAIESTRSTLLGAVSVGNNVDGNRQIVNVAAGRDDSDAVNVSQLKGVDAKVNEGFGLRAADGNTVMKPLGEQVEVIGSNSNITTTAANGKVEIALNNNLDLDTNGSVRMGSGGLFGLGSVTTVNRNGMRTGNILRNTVVTDSGVSVNGIFGNSALATDGLTISNGPSVLRSGIDAGNKKITNVKAGSQPLDAVNVSQLSRSAAGSRTEVEAGTNVAVTNIPGANGQNVYKINADGTTVSGSTAVTVTAGSKNATTNLTDYAVDLSQVTKDSLVKADNSVQYDNAGQTSVTLGGTGSTTPVTLTNVKAGSLSSDSTDAVNGSQLHATNTKVNEGFGLRAADGNTVMKPLGEQVEVIGSNSNITTTAANGKVEIALNNNLDLDTNGSVRMGSGGLFGLGSVTTVNRNGMRTGNILRNTVVTDSGVSVNGIFGNSALATDGLTISNGPSVLRSGIDAGNKKITNVKAGSQPLDAVNVSQLSRSAAGSRTEVEAGTNVAVTNIPGANGQNVYKINADGTTVSGSTAVTVTAGSKNATTNLTDYAVDLSQVTKDSLVKADNSVQYDNAGQTSVTLGGTGSTTPVTLTNVKAGSTEFDAVNFGQLETTNNAVNRGLDFTGDNTDSTSIINRKSGQLLKTTGGNTDLTNLSDDNIGVIANNITNTLTVKLAKDLTGLNSASFGNDVMISSTGLRAGTTVVNTSGVSFSDSTVSLSSTGLNNGGKVITNVARGTELTDAVNVEQLNEVKQSATDANKGWNISAQGANISTVKPTDTVDLNNTDNNITVSKTAESNNVTFNLSRDIAIDSLQTGDATMNSSGLTIVGGPKLTKTSVDAGGNKITNVANGFIEVASKDAVNGGQLFEVLSSINTQTAVIAEMGAGLNFDADSGPVINKKAGSAPLTFKGGNNITTTSAGSSIKFDLNGNINVDSVTTGDTTVSTNGVVIAGGPSIIKAGIYAGNGETAPSMTAAGINAAGTKITNVADGMQPRDAVNFGQLDAVNRNLGNSINELGYRIGEVEDDANAGISAAMAMSSLPQAYIIGKSMIGGGIATYNGESAVAIGFSKLSADGRWVMKLNGTADTQGNVGAAIGAGFHFD